MTVNGYQKTSTALKSPYEELAELLKQQHHLYIDETSFKKNGKLQWAWCFVWSKMQLADRNVVDSAIGHVVFVKLGDPKSGAVPVEEYIEYITRQIAKAGTAGSKSYIVLPPFLELVSDPGTLATFLGKAKFDMVLEAVYSTYGIPAALTETASGAAANNFMSMKVLTKKLTYVRKLLVRDFWNEEVKHAHAAFNFKSPFFITFTYQELGDEAAIKKLIENMYDREVISTETYRYMMDVNHELEESRIQNERERRQKGELPPKAGPYHNRCSI